jgi:uncharacterized iron-regulated membrane protein
MALAGNSGNKGIPAVNENTGYKTFYKPRAKKRAGVTTIATKQSIQRWNRKARRLFLIWLITAILFLAISILIYKSIGFKES